MEVLVENWNISQKSKFLVKNPNFSSKIQIFGQKSKLWSKIKIFGQKSKFLVKNLNVGQKLNLWLINRHFGQKLKPESKIIFSVIEIVVPVIFKSKLWWKIVFFCLANFGQKRKSFKFKYFQFSQNTFVQKITIVLNFQVDRLVVIILLWQFVEILEKIRKSILYFKFLFLKSFLHKYFQKVVFFFIWIYFPSYPKLASERKLYKEIIFMFFTSFWANNFCKI